MRKRLYLDLDGTLARFHDEPDYLSHMYRKGFFLNLRPFENVIQAIKIFMRQHPDIEVSVLSTVVSGYYCQKEKLKWVKHYLPQIGSVILVPEGSSKTNFISNLSRHDVLIDDYNLNLKEWEKGGGLSVKLVNNINHMGRRGKKWTGETIRYDASPYSICAKLATVFYCTQISFFEAENANILV